MTEATKTIVIEPESELGQALDVALGSDIILEKDGVRFHLQRIGAAVASEPADAARAEPPAPERLLNIIGLGAVSAGSDVARLKDRYVAEATANSD